MSECCSAHTTQSPVSAEMPCPVSGTRSKQVGLVTIQSLVRHLPFHMVAAQYYFCEAADCDVAYFPSNPTAPTFHRDDLLVRVGVKETHNPIPLCYCFGITRETLEEEIRQMRRSTVTERIKAEVKAGRCACELKNPSGRCCLGDVSRAVKGALQRIGKEKAYRL